MVKQCYQAIRRIFLLKKKYVTLTGIIKESLVTCNFSSLFVFDEFVFALLFESNGEPAMHAGAETSRSQ